jgi:methylated-DNA-[protein]-cysteine S-methyltransferase
MNERESRTHAVRRSASAIAITALRTPVGALWIALRDGAACAIGFDEQWPLLMRALDRRFGAVTMQDAQPSDAIARLAAYFDGDVAAIEGVRVDMGGTPFQRAVWAALRAIPVGSTMSYAELARTIGAPRAIRAVGRANALNPVSLVVPCHRVIATSGELRGYAGGLPRKSWLLEHERRYAARGSSIPSVIAHA